MTSYSKTQSEQTIASTLSDLAGQKVLVLLSGGSSAEIGAKALAMLDSTTQQNITVALADERFVPYGSQDSNATVLKSFRVIENCGAFLEVLSATQTTRQASADAYRQRLTDAWKAADFIVAVLGVGVDNHTAGLLPSSVAVESNEELIVEYATEEYERISLAPKAFEAIDFIFVYAEGADKEPAMAAIADEYPVTQYPSQLVKRASSYELLFNKESL